MDKIIIKDFLVQGTFPTCYHHFTYYYRRQLTSASSGVIGVNESERHKNQNIYITLVIYYDFTAVHKSDHVSDTVNYSWVAKKLEKLVKETQARTLEHLACVVADWVLTIEGVEKCEVEVSKPSAITLAKSATVFIERTRSHKMEQKRKTTLTKHIVPLLESKFLYDSKQETKLNHSVVYLALGSNLGNRAENIETALELIKTFASLDAVSFLYETPAQYVVDQPPYLNACCKIQTSLGPEALLEKLKSIEQAMGRKAGIRYGPRVIDLDILFYADLKYQTSILTIPHPQMHERDFVLGPLMDICPDHEHPVLKKNVRSLFMSLPKVTLRQVTPVRFVQPDGTKVEELLYFDKATQTYIMGVLNTTPDSFSDGGQYNTVESALNRALEMANAVSDSSGDQHTVQRRALIIDIGGESTRPGADPVPAKEEMSRVVPVIQALRAHDKLTNVLISVDTFKPSVAEQAIKAGANIINDVTGGNYVESDDGPQMFDIAVKYRVPIVIMHIRGTPKTMTSLALYTNEMPIVESVATELVCNIQRALCKGVYPWQIITDPGIGFAKKAEQNVALLREMHRWHVLVGHFGLMIGASRKKFIGDITRQKEPKNRVFGTAAVVTSSIASGAHIVRVHDVREMYEVSLMADALYREKL